MSKIRKDNYVVTNDGTYGKVLSVNGPEATLSTSNGEQTVNREDLTKVSAEDYRNATESGETMQTEVKAEKVSKMDLAREVFNRMYGTEGIKRKDIIEAMISEANLTKAGAGTYYYNLTKEVRNS